MKIKNNSPLRLLWLRPLQAAFLFLGQPLSTLYIFAVFAGLTPLPYQDYPKALTARFCPFYCFVE